MILYIIIGIIFLLIILHGAIRIKYKFWVNQPLYSKYQLITFFRNNYIINSNIPEINNKINFINIDIHNIIDNADNQSIFNNRIFINTLKDIDYSNLIKLFNSQSVYFSQSVVNGLNNKGLEYHCTEDTLKNLLLNHSYPGIVGTYKKIYYKQDINNENIINDFMIYGYLMKIPLFYYTKIENKKDIISLKIIYFVDNIIYDKFYVKEKELLELITTTEYKHQKDWIDIIKNKNNNKPIINISLYKYTNTKIPSFIIPFSNYKSYYFDMSLWKNINYNLHSSIHIIKIGTSNINILFDFFKSNQIMNLFSCSFIPSLAYITHLIKNNIYNIYVLLEKKSHSTSEHIYAIYFFKKANMVYNKKEILYTNITINNKCNDELFLCGFNNVIKYHNKNSIYTILKIDDISNSNKIISNILLNYKPIYIENHSLIFYNYICKPLLSSQIVIMN